MNVETFSKIFAEEWSKYKTQAEKDISTLEKFNKVDSNSVPTFEEDPIKYILYSYPTLKESLEQLLTKDFLDYITGIYIIAPIPTTFKVILHNNQYFYMIYMGRTWVAKVAGKKYYLLNVGERGRAIESIARLLAMGSPIDLEPSQEAAENQTTESPLDTSGEETSANPFSGAPPSEGPAEPKDQTTPLVESKQKKKILLEFSKKYPQAFRILTKQALILEGTFNQNSGKVVQKILGSKENQEFGFLPMSDVRRLANPNKIEPDMFQDLLQSLYPNEEIKIIPPRVSPNPSSKFPMYQLDTEYGPAGVILASGANKGEKYEKDFYESMRKNAGVPDNQIDNPEIKQLYDYLEIDNENLSPDQIQNTGKGNNKRQLSFGGPEDVGQKIADITIMPDIYLSIKDPKGTGIYNGGNLKFIKQSKEDQSIYFDKQEFNNDSSVTKEIMDIISIDPQRIAIGLNDYQTKEGAPNGWEEITDYNDTLVHNLLASAYGYGYYYVRQVKPGEIKVVSIESPEDAYEMVGDIKSIKVKYPGISSKSGEVRIETSSQLMGDNVYQIDIRNSMGGILPGIKIKTLK
jgi:hypothetical protein